MGFGSEMGGCGHFAKYGMFISNFVIFIGGITVFVIGVWTLVDKSFINELLGTNLFMGAVYILIATGALVTLVSFFGCLGAVKEIKCMLLAYFIMVLIIFVVMLVGGILGYVFREKVRYSMEQEMYSSIKAYNEKKSLRRAWDDTQENLHCCGVTSFTDWRGIIPDSCCRDLAGKKLPCNKFQSDGNIYTDGCLRAAEVFVKDHASIIGGAAITVSCLMIFGLIFAFILFKII